MQCNSIQSNPIQSWDGSQADLDAASLALMRRLRRDEMLGLRSQDAAAELAERGVHFEIQLR